MPSSRQTSASQNGHFNSIDEFDLLLGRSVRYFQQLEQMVEIRLRQLVSASSAPVGHLAEFLGIAVAEVSFRTKLRLLDTLLAQLASRSEYKARQNDPKKRISLDREMEHAKAALKRLGKLEEGRNRYVHSFWLALGPPSGSTEPVTVTRTKTRAHPKQTFAFEEFSAHAFLDFLAEALEVQEEFGQSTGRLLGLLNYDEEKKRKKV